MGVRPARTALVIALVGLASAGRAADEPGPQAREPAGEVGAGGDGTVEPPPGEPADLALWRSGGEASQAVVVARTEAARVQLRVRSGHLLERLEAAASAGAGTAGAARLGELRARLLAAWNESYEVLMRRWPVDPTRGCSYPVMLLESALRTPERMARRADLGLAREELAECVARAGLATAAMRRATEALRAAADAAEAALEGDRAGSGRGT